MSEPPRSSTSKFWKDIWEKETTHNTTAHWLKRLKESHQHTVAQQGLTISKEDIKCRVQRMKNWATSGHDMIQAFWLKKLTSLHTRMAKQMECLIEQGDHPEWLTKGRTVLLMKRSKAGADSQKLSTNNVLAHNLETAFRNSCRQTGRAHESLYDQCSERNWAQLPRS